MQQVGGGGAVALAGELVAAGPGPGAEVGALGEQHQLLRGLALVVSIIELYTKVMRRFAKFSSSNHHQHEALCPDAHLLTLLHAGFGPRGPQDDQHQNHHHDFMTTI